MSSFRKEYRLTPFEEYMFWDETPAFPMASWQMFRFSGKLDPDLLQESLRAAVLRHPLMNARIVLRCGKPYWEYRDDLPELFCYDSAEEEKSLPLPDIRKTCGFRAFYRAGEDEGRPYTELGVSVHHSVADGMGIMGFFEDAFINYAARKGVAITPGVYPPISPDSMRERLAPNQTWGRYFKLLSNGTKSTRDLLLHDAKPLLPVRRIDYKTPVEHPILYKTFELSAEQSAAYRAKAKELGLSINDRMLVDFIRSCGDFRKKFVPTKNQWIRVAMPVNMRSPEIPPLFATNVVSMVFIDRRPSQIGDDDEFVRGIHRETDWIKRTDQGYTLLVNLRSKRNTFGGIKIVLHGRRCWSTTVLSNLGILFKQTPLPRTDDGRLIVGDCVLDTIWGMPPIRAKTFTSWSVRSYAGRLGMAMRFDERYLTSEQIAFAFDACKRRVFHTIGAPAEE